MTFIEQTSNPLCHPLSIDDVLSNAYVKYNDTDLSKATYFELRPIYDSEYTSSGYFYGNDSNYVQIRMGQHARPCELIAKYRFNFASDACRDFFELAQLGKPLWYSGNDILVQVADVVDLAIKIADECFDADEDMLKELFDNVGLDEDERKFVLAKLSF